MFLSSDGKLYYNFKGRQRLVLFTRDEVCEALRESHDQLGTGGHPGRRRTYEKASASYHWDTIREDVYKWVRDFYGISCCFCEEKKCINIAPLPETHTQSIICVIYLSYLCIHNFLPAVFSLTNNNRILCVDPIRPSMVQRDAPGRHEIHVINKIIFQCKVNEDLLLNSSGLVCVYMYV